MVTKLLQNGYFSDLSFLEVMFIVYKGPININLRTDFEISRPSGSKAFVTIVKRLLLTLSH